ncbi:UvrD-helicase domain-containing protein [Deinococcus gobiensis]|uniref:DNA 3'-5' helicase n=1 Tax=Deinococcus gobiensis (strain DSM 21396 / JCM 16679 / CGMCC 1.7299 / I-0) TaxID=745776 RepID=H8H2S0_DEIGI|nr:UvrD-helicase domain-containing protein [Deinococcus gobiensis]AFD27817.1 UvrD/REP helicase [Deinococcus gobiensis I-0]
MTSWPAPARDIPAFFTPQQHQFMTMVRTTGQHIFLRATAGAGKTTTLVEAAWHLPQPGVFFAYNKHAVADLQPRLPARMRARTLHAHGVMLLRQTTGRDIVPHEDKARKVALLAGERRHTYIAALAWSKAREEGLRTLDVDAAAYLTSLVEWPGSPDALIHLIPRMHEIGQHLWERDGLADFTDFLWLPATNGYGAASLQVALVDEAQDLTPLRQAFILQLLGLPRSAAPGRLIFVGDPDQAVYLHAGADKEALGRLKTRVKAVEMPLSVSFRCPRDVVAYAQAYSTFIRPAPTAKPGTIEHLSAEEATFERGDVVLCRTNAPLIRLALQLMVQGRSVSVVGRDLEKRLGEGLRDILPATGSYLNDDVTELVRGYYQPKADPLKERIRQGDRPAKRILTELLDISKCLRFLAWIVSRKEGNATLQQALTLLAALCREQTDAEVILSSVHRAKGKEWPRVTLLYPEMMPMASGDPEEETAVQFVAVTRSQDTLRFAYGKESWATGWRVKPGGQVQPAPPSRTRENEDETALLAGSPPVVSPPQAAPAGEATDFQALPSLPPVIPPATKTPALPGQGRTRLKVEPSAVPSGAAEPAPVRVAQPSSPPPPAKWAQMIPRPEAAPHALVEDDREWALFGGTAVLDRQDLQERLEALQEEPRPFLATWATTSLELLHRNPEEAVSIQLEVLEQFEQAARLARLAVPSTSTTAAQLHVCVFEGNLARIRVGRVVRRHVRFLRLEVDGQELVFERRYGELLEGGTPLTPFIVTTPPR